MNTEWTQVEIIHLETDCINGFGFGITGNKSTGVVVKSITPGGSANRNGNLRLGDHFFQIGKINVRSMSSEQIASIIRQLIQTQHTNQLVQFVVARPIRESQNHPTGNTSLLLNQNSKTSQIIKTQKLIDTKIINLNFTKTDDSLIQLSPPTPTDDNSIYIDCILNRENTNEIFGIGITEPDEKHKIYYINELIIDSIADKLNKINIYDQIIEINDNISNLAQIKTILSNDLRIKMKLKRNIKEIHKILEDKWHSSTGNEIICHEIDKLNTSCLGISLEGTVDIENGQETHSHHYIRSIQKDGPIDKCQRFEICDELLEINGNILHNISYIDLLNILKNLPMKMMTVVCARSKKIAQPVLKTTILPAQAGRTPPIRSRSLELDGLAMWNTKINYIELLKTDKGLGFSIIDYSDPFNTLNNAIVIRSLVPNGAAQLDGRLLPGYRLVSVNSTSVENSSLDVAVGCLKEAPRGVVKLGIQKPLPYPYSMNDLDLKTKSASVILTKDEEDDDDLLNDETIKLLNEDDVEYGCAAMSAPAILNQIHYETDGGKFKYTPKLDNVLEVCCKVEEERCVEYNDNSDLDDFFLNNNNYPDDNDDDYGDYDDNETDSTGTASSNSIKSSLQSPEKDIIKDDDDGNFSLVIKNNDEDFEEHEYGEFVYSYENIRFLVSWKFCDFLKII